MQEDRIASLPSDARLTPLQLGGLTLFVLVLLLGAFGYAIHEHNLASHLSGQNAQMLSALNDTRNQMMALASRLNAPAPSPDPEKAPQKTVVSGGKPSGHITRRTAGHRRSEGDARWRQINNKLAEHDSSIQSTRKELADTRTELQGSIARTH